MITFEIQNFDMKSKNNILKYIQNLKYLVKELEDKNQFLCHLYNDTFNIFGFLYSFTFMSVPGASQL